MTSDLFIKSGIIKKLGALSLGLSHQRFGITIVGLKVISPFSLFGYVFDLGILNPNCAS